MENNEPKEQTQYVYLLETGGQYYVGSTSNIRLRKAMHKSLAKRGSTHKVHRAIRENGGEFEMTILVEMNDTRTERQKEEQRWIERLSAELNERRSSTGMARDEYQRQMSRERYRNDPEKYKEISRLRAQHVCECKCGTTFKGPQNRKNHEKTAKHATLLQQQTKPEEYYLLEDCPDI